MSIQPRFKTAQERQTTALDLLDGHLYDRPSRSQKKRESDSLRQLGATLVELSPGRLAKLELPAELRRAVDEARRLDVHGAKKRQIQYIGRVMEDCDEEAIRASLAAIDTVPAAAVAKPRTHQATAEALLSGDDAAIFAVASRYAPSAGQMLRQAVRKAQKQVAAGTAPAAAQRDIERCLDGLVVQAD